MKALFYTCIFSFFLLFTACEEVIDINLNEADPRFVIEAELSDLDAMQQIRVSQTVAFTATVNSTPVENAVVTVTDNRGRVYTFQYDSNGNYTSGNFRPVEGRTYSLLVIIGEERFESVCTMPRYVEIDSVGILEELVFNNTFYFATFKFNDPEGIANYYKYDIAINGGSFRFANVLNDKFNDGLYVTHQVADLDTDLVEGDQVTVRRYCIDSSVFDYWNELQSTNPGTAAPGNPTSNISNNALGYFSVATVQEFDLQIPGSASAELDNNAE